MSKLKIGIIGGGWRAEFFIRCARAIPNEFDVVSVLLRNKEKAEQLSQKLDVAVTTSFDEFIACGFDYVIISLPREIVLEYIEKLFKVNIPILCETPPGETLEDYIKLWDITKKYSGKIQVAEQYFEWPLFSGWLNVISQGVIGEVSNVSISAAHGYHGVNLIRKFLGVEFENCTIYGKTYDFPVAYTGGREGRDYSGKISNVQRQRLTFEFDNGKVAFFDFSGEQYRSRIRTRHLNIQGSKGEIDDLSVSYLNTKNEIVTQKIYRDELGINRNQDSGNFGLMLGDNYIYKNPFFNSRLNDDETAIASLMCQMRDFIQSGKEFYSLKDALQDSYLALLMDEALASPLSQVKSSSQLWCE